MKYDEHEKINICFLHFKGIFLGLFGLPESYVTVIIYSTSSYEYIDHRINIICFLLLH